MLLSWCAGAALAAQWYWGVATYGAAAYVTGCVLWLVLRAEEVR